MGALPFCLHPRFILSHIFRAASGEGCFSAVVIISLPPAARVVADLMGGGIAVCGRAAIPCIHSVAPPLPEEAYASPGAWTGDEGREFCAEQRDQVTYAGGSNGGQTAPLGREEGPRGTIRKVPRAILWFLSHRGERNAPPARRPGSRDHACKEEQICSLCSLIRHPPCGRRRLPPSPRGCEAGARE